MKEIFKPITSSIATLKSKNKKKEQKNDGSDSSASSSDGVLETERFRPKRVFASTPITPARKRLTFPKSVKHRTATTGTREVFHSLGGDSTVVSSIKKRRKTGDRSFLSIRSPPRTRLQSQKQLERVDTNNFTYQLEFDDDPVQNYGNMPADDLVCHGKRIAKSDGKETPVKLLWKDLPQDMKAAWLQRRGKVSSYLKRLPMNQTVSHTLIGQMLEASLTDSEDEGAQSLPLQRSKRGAGMKMKKTMDLSFIPYKSNNNIVYEYFDNPNELCERLRLLISSRVAGNTNHMQEINSILEELRELGCIK